MTIWSLLMCATTASDVPAAATAYGSAEHKWSNQVSGGFWGISWHQISGELLPSAMECNRHQYLGQICSDFAQDCVSEPPGHSTAEFVKVDAWQHSVILAEASLSLIARLRDAAMSYLFHEYVGVQCVQADNVKQMSLGVKASMAAFWTPDRLHQLAQTLAYHFFTLTVSHLLPCLAVSATPCAISHSPLLV